MADNFKEYDMAGLARDQIAYVRKLATDGLAKVTVRVEHKTIEMPDAKARATRKASK